MGAWMGQSLLSTHPLGKIPTANPNVRVKNLFITTTIILIPISMGLNEYEKRYGLQNVTALPKIFYIISEQYSGHYFSASDDCNGTHLLNTASSTVFER